MTAFGGSSRGGKSGLGIAVGETEIDTYKLNHLQQ